MRHRIGRRLRTWADRIDHEHAFRRTSGLSFTFERGFGIAINEIGRGCPLWYYGPDYDRAHSEAWIK